MRIAEVTERVKKYLLDVSRLMKNEAMVISIGTHLDVDRSVIEHCITGQPGSVQLAAFNMLKEWKRPIQTNDLNALRSRLRHAFEEHMLVEPFLNIDIT